MIVEDDRSMSNLCEMIINNHFKGSNIIVSQASNGLEALDKVKKHEYSVILLDIEMPEMNGIDFYKRLKKENPTLAKRTGFISGNIYKPQISYFDKECRPYIKKPFSRVDLYKFIDSIIKSET